MPMLTHILIHHTRLRLAIPLLTRSSIGTALCLEWLRGGKTMAPVHFERQKIPFLICNEKQSRNLKVRFNKDKSGTLKKIKEAFSFKLQELGCKWLGNSWMWRCFILLQKLLSMRGMRTTFYCKRGALLETIVLLDLKNSLCVYQLKNDCTNVQARDQ